MTRSDTLQALTRDTFLRLADTLAAQPAAAWDRPSLCERWRVREVVANLSGAARYSPQEYMAEVEADGGDFNATIDRLAARDGQRPPSTLVADLRSDELHRWIPPGGGALGALTHVVIHGLDVTTPLRLDCPAGDAALAAVLDALAGGLHPTFGVELDAVHLRATDLEWAWGNGRTVTATAADLVIAMAGRAPDVLRDLS